MRPFGGQRLYGAWALTCSRFLLSRSRWDPSQGYGEHGQASKVLGGVLDEPGVAAVDLEQRGGAVPEQPQRVPLAVGERRVPDGPLHLSQHARVGDVVDVTVPQLRGGGKKHIRNLKTLLKSHSESEHCDQRLICRLDKAAWRAENKQSDIRVGVTSRAC